MLKITNLSNFQDLSLTESLQRAMDIELGQPTYTNLKGVKGRFYSPAYVAMKFAKQNWNLNKGEGPIKFFISSGL